MLTELYAWIVANALKLGAAVLVAVAAVTYIDRKATYRERDKWQAKVEEAKRQARRQDDNALVISNQNQKITIDALSTQKALDDAEIKRLKADVAKRPVSQRCIATEADADPVPRRSVGKPLRLWPPKR